IEAGLLALKSGQIKAFVYDKAILDFYLAQAEFEDNLLSFPINSNKEYFSFAAGEKDIIHEINPFLVDVIESKEWGAMLKKYGLQED
ncbi:MAG: transporter substrate-binding domain-containing protein, partial [Bacteroidales bacterium]|nr:transporter substrate-binding domain-containing protein [Bacteroidales bacterium]